MGSKISRRNVFRARFEEKRRQKYSIIEESVQQRLQPDNATVMKIAAASLGNFHASLTRCRLRQC